MDFNATLRGWAELLNRVRTVAPSAFLAGGAMRDLDNGRPVKDLDVFFNEDTVADYHFERALKDRYVRKGGVSDCSYIDAASEIFSTTIFMDLELGPDLNMINVAPEFDTTKMLERMDFGICLIGFNGEQVIRTAPYMVDQCAQTFTLTRADDVNGTIRSLRRYERLVQKYEGWKLVVPDHLREIAGKAIESHEHDKVVIKSFRTVLANLPGAEDCPMCDGTGYKDHAGFCMDPCDHTAPGLCDAPSGGGHTTADCYGECRRSGQCQAA